MVKDLLITLEDQPGEGAKLGEALGQASINIEGLCAVVDEGRGIVHILVEDPAPTRDALEEELVAAKSKKGYDPADLADLKQQVREARQDYRAAREV